jgi:hypothetical protein
VPAERFGAASHDVGDGAPVRSWHRRAPFAGPHEPKRSRPRNGDGAPNREGRQRPVDRHRRPSALRLETATSDREDCQQHTIRVAGPSYCAACSLRHSHTASPAQVASTTTIINTTTSGSISVSWLPPFERATYAFSRAGGYLVALRRKTRQRLSYAMPTTRASHGDKQNGNARDGVSRARRVPLIFLAHRVTNVRERQGAGRQHQLSPLPEAQARAAAGSGRAGVTNPNARASNS